MKVISKAAKAPATHLTSTRHVTVHEHPEPASGWMTRVLPVGRAIAQTPGLKPLRRVGGRLLAVARPTMDLYHRAFPAAHSPGNGVSVKVVSANLFHDWPRYRRMHDRIEAFAGLVEREMVDIVLLQEVARTPNLRVDEWLAQRLGMAYVYSRANGHEKAVGFEEGLAVFSRFPLWSPQIQRLKPEPVPFVRRLALAATVLTPWGDLPVFSVHLGLGRRMNATQMAQLQSWVGSVADGRAALIGGDFNADETTPQVRNARKGWVDTFRQIHPTADGTTFELLWPWGKPLLRSRLDYLFLDPGNRQWKVLEARHLDTPEEPHSDHRAVFAHLLPQ